ncbi:uncharacterized protein V1518DRAFT_423195 [Limtongia smithiae]|uniref:uncharacterized protein n=1 Tax=Limtongia smithiae TaxID=1125753 RepID=UPI0034CD61C7
MAGIDDVVILGIPLKYIIAAFLAASPITSYADQMFYVWRRKSSDGFALDTCALLIAVSSLRIFYWFGRPLELPIFLQSCTMLGVQLIYLKMALMYMPAAWRRVKHMEDVFIPFNRPFHFWQWTSDWKFYICIAIFFAIVGIFELFLHNFDTWFAIIARVAVALEAVLPLPQLILNYTRHSLSGFRFTLLFAWVSGDFVKTLFYYIDDQEYYYKVGGTSQTILDFAILWQYFYYWRKQRLEAKRLKEMNVEVDVLSVSSGSSVYSATSADEDAALLGDHETVMSIPEEAVRPAVGKEALIVDQEIDASVAEAAKLAASVV